MPAAQTAPGARAASAPPGVCATGSPVSLRDLLQSLILKQLIRDDPLQPRVPALELLQPLRILSLQAAVLLPPTMQRLLGYLQLLRDRGDLLTLPKQPIGLTQLPDDLLRRMPAMLRRHR